MVMNKSNWFTLMVAICFAILQALQPFIHAHMDADHPVHHTGFHVGDEHEEVFDPGYLANHSISSIPHASHTISVASGIKQDTDATLLAHAILAVVLSVFFVLAFASTKQFNPALGLVPYSTLRRRLPASRAPPQF